MYDPSRSKRELRAQRLPIVAKYRTRFHYSFSKIIEMVEVECGQKVSKTTIKSDWDLLVKEWRTEAANDTKRACDEALMNCDTVIAELSTLYERKKDVKILTELRRWEERRDKLHGLDKVHIDVTTGDKPFTGFGSILPVISGIEDIVRQMDERREREETE